MVKESDFRLELKKSYEQRHGAACFALSWPSMYISADSLDLFLCLSGKFTAIEVKLVKELPKNRDKNMLSYGFTALQVKTLQRISQAGGAAFGVICVRPLRIAAIIPIECISEDFVLSESSLRLYEQVAWDSRRGVWEV